jgi:hypothetical protein
MHECTAKIFQYLSKIISDIRTSVDMNDFESDVKDNVGEV